MKSDYKLLVQYGVQARIGAKGDFAGHIICMLYLLDIMVFMPSYKLLVKSGQRVTICWILLTEDLTI